MEKSSEKAGGTRERILDAAMKVFMEKGYEDASVRAILEASGTVAGSFYHFFGSKEALFEAVVERYLAGYAAQFAAIAKAPDMDVRRQLDALLEGVSRGAEVYFGELHGEKLHWTVQYALHERTLQAIAPSVSQLVENAISSGAAKSRLHTDARTLSAVLIKGIEGILHAHPMEEMTPEQLAAAKESIREYIGLLLELQP